MKAPRKTDTRIPRRPLLWLAAALLFTLPPMVGNLSSWITGFFVIALAGKFLMEPKGYRLRSLVVKVILVTCALAGIFLSYGTLKGIEPGVSLIVLLMSIKILEAHTAREFQVMVMVAFVLCLCGFFLSQNLVIALSLSIAFVLLLVALVQFHRGSSSTFWPPVRVALKLFVQAIPIIVLLFFLFPRVSTGFRLQIAQTQNAGAGFSGQLSPGSVAALANSSDIAFRAEFPDGKIPPLSAMYWRGAVMWRCDGLNWQAPEAPASIPRANRPEPAGQPVRQAITIEPHHGHWLFALDRPAAPPFGAILAPGSYLWSVQPIHRQRRYEITSYPATREKELRPRERKLLLQVRAPISPRLWSLVQSWTTKSGGPRTIVNHALEFFRTQGFRYSLSPGEYKKNDLDEFLFERRLGFCEHYASSFATLMRLAGIPARVVTGYLGGEYNEIGNFFVVRQADAHAWCEIWLPDTGWERIDPTAVVAPDRINLGLSLFLERRAASSQTADPRGTLSRNLARWPVFARARLAWQTLNYEWDTRVISFDNEAQESFVAALGLAELGAAPSLVGAATIVIALLGCYAAWSRFRSRRASNRIKELYDVFCRKIARMGVARYPTEGPLAFSKRASKSLPGESSRIKAIADIYIAVCYASRKDRHLLNDLAREVVLLGRHS